MTTVVRTPVEAERDQVIDVLRTSLNFTQAWADGRGPTMPLEDYRCVFDRDRVVSVAAAFPFRQWFGGRDISMSGVYAVATLPEYRATGLASSAVLQILREARDGDDVLSTLFPAVLRPYRKLGYELAGTYSEHRLSLDAIPAELGEDLPPVEVLDIERDLDGVKACYRDWCRHHNGPLEPIDDTWWTRRILRPFGDAIARSVVVRGAGGVIEGFASFRHAETEGHLEIDFGLECLAFATTSGRATRALLAYFRSFRGVGVWVQWCGPPEDPIAMLLSDQRLTTPFRYRWMLRLLNVPAALSGRGYPAIDAEARFSVDDPQFPENHGPWRLAVRAGEATVEASTEPTTRPLSIGVLSALFSGFLRVPDAVRLGYLDAVDPAAAAFERLFAGADPWCPFFF